MTETMSNIKVNQRGLSVEHDERRVYELGFGNPDKNFRNYKPQLFWRKLLFSCSAMSVLLLPVWVTKTSCLIRGMTFLIR